MTLSKNVQVIDEYLAKHRADISDEHRSIVEGRKRRIGGDFILERHLKSGSVFIASHTEEVYLVSGIISSREEIFYYRSPPIMLNAVSYSVSLCYYFGRACFALQRGFWQKLFKWVEGYLYGC